MIRVFVRASSPIAKAGLESLLRSHSGFGVAEDSGATSEGVRSALESSPGVLVAEADTLSDRSAREAIDWAGVGGIAVLLVRHPASEAISEALRAGVKAVVSSSLPEPEIVKAVEAAAAGLVVLDAPGVETLLRASSTVSGGRAEELREALTPREIEVLQLLAAGLGNKEIASRLGISDHTVKFHVASVMGKLGAASRTEAVTSGIRLGLVMV